MTPQELEVGHPVVVIEWDYSPRYLVVTKVGKKYVYAGRIQFGAVIKHTVRRFILKAAFPLRGKDYPDSYLYGSADTVIRLKGIKDAISYKPLSDEDISTIERILGVTQKEEQDNV